MTLVFAFDFNCKSFPRFSTVGNKADLGLYIYLVSISNFVVHGEIIENENVLLISGPGLLLKFEIFG